MIKTVTVYTRDDCVFCEKVVQWLNDNHIKFMKKNVTNNNDNLLEFKEFNVHWVPLVIVKYDDSAKIDSVVGFKTKKLKSLLLNQEDKPFKNQLEGKEAAKMDFTTVNYKQLVKSIVETGHGYVLLEKESKDEYVKLAENNTIMNEEIENLKFNPDHTKVSLITGDELGQGVVYVQGTLAENNTHLVYALFDYESKELSNFGSAITDESSNVTLTVYNQEGTIIFANSSTPENTDQASTLDYDWDSFWIAIVCGFSGGLACGSGCLSFGPAFPVCFGICDAAWNAGICSQA